jgi:hypothetical protein
MIQATLNRFKPTKTSQLIIAWVNMQTAIAPPKMANFILRLLELPPNLRFEHPRVPSEM